MKNVLFQNFVDLITRDHRPLKPSIYPELGTIIVALCKSTPKERLNADAQEISARLFLAEMRSPESHLRYYRHIGALFQILTDNNSFKDKKYREKLKAFIENAKQDIAEPVEREFFEDELADGFGGPQNTPPDMVLGEAANRLCHSMMPLPLNPEAFDCAREIIQVALETYSERTRNNGDPEGPSQDEFLEEARDESAAAQMIAKGVAVFISHEGGSARTAQDADAGQPQPVMRSGPRLIHPLCGLLDTRLKLKELTETVLHWENLRCDNGRTHCLDLVHLIEVLSDIPQRIDLPKIDFLNERASVFVE